LGEGVVRRSHDGAEDLGGTHLPGELVEHRDGIAGEVHEQLLAGRVVCRMVAVMPWRHSM
jgi:hypothetical protein